MTVASLAFEWMFQWTPAIIAGVAIAAAGCYLLRGKFACRPVDGSCLGTSGNAALDKGRENDIVNDVNPLEKKLPRFTLQELKDCNGRGDGRLHVGIQGLVYDVGAHEAGRGFYGPGGSYHLFAGRDATTALAKMALEESMLNSSPETWFSFSDEERRCIRQWANRFCSKYPLAGIVDFGPDGNKAATEWRAEIAKA